MTPIAQADSDSIARDLHRSKSSVCRPEPTTAVRLLTTLKRRAMYCARFIYWTAKHRSTKHVAWVLAFEGYTW